MPNLNLSLIVAVTLSCTAAHEPAAAAHEPAAASEPKTRSSNTKISNPAPPLVCTRAPFASQIDIAEASGATILEDGSILVIGDSDTQGAYLRIDSKLGTILSRGSLPLDPRSSDDLEGLARIGDRIYALTSSGYIREWTARNGKFKLERESYPLASPKQEALRCDNPLSTNCGPNYEGLCIVSDAKQNHGQRCVGYAASKAQGALLCLVLRPDGRLGIRPEHHIIVSRPKTLSGCDFDSQGRLWFGNNLFAGNTVGYVTGHQDVNTAVITKVGPLGLGFQESIVLGPSDEVFRFSDTATAPSLLGKYICL